MALERNETNRYRLFSRHNLPAYSTVMLLWTGASSVLGFLLKLAVGNALAWSATLVFAGVSVMCGMGIMFGASALNLRKLRPGFERLAAGSRDPAIPSVWCPVLTMATRAALELSERLRSTQQAPRGPAQPKATPPSPADPPLADSPAPLATVSAFRGGQAEDVRE